MAVAQKTNAETEIPKAALVDIEHSMCAQLESDKKACASTAQAKKGARRSQEDERHVPWANETARLRETCLTKMAVAFAVV